MALVPGSDWLTSIIPLSTELSGNPQKNSPRSAKQVFYEIIYNTILVLADDRIVFRHLPFFKSICHRHQGKPFFFLSRPRTVIPSQNYVKSHRQYPLAGRCFTPYYSGNERDWRGPTNTVPAQEDGKALLGFYPNSVIQIGLYMVDALDQTNGGNI